MKINRLALIAAVDKAIEREDQAIRAAKTRAENERQLRLDQWVARNREPWLEACKKIAAKLRKGQPVLDADIPYDRSPSNNGNAVWRERHHVNVPQRDTTLPGLRALLEAIADDTVTTSSLRDLGVSARTLQSIVPLLGANTATASRKAST